MKINDNNSIIPPFLKEGDYIEVVAPAKFVSLLDLEYASRFFEKHKFKLIFNNTVFEKKNVFAGTVEQRINSINKALCSNRTKAILFARGGYGSIQIIDSINFEALNLNPKWLIGFSDITTILMHAYSQFNICSIHGPMAYNFKNIGRNAANSMVKMLKGEKINIRTESNLHNNMGQSNGKLIGGNLSIICSLIGSKSMPSKFDDSILFIEDVDEYAYHLERMIYFLDRAGILRKIKGLIVGQMTAIHDNPIGFGKDPSMLIKDIVKKYNYPVCFNFPIGHVRDNYPIIIGRRIRLEINELFAQISYE